MSWRAAGAWRLMLHMQVRQHDAPKLGVVRARQAEAARRSKRMQQQAEEASNEASKADRRTIWVAKARRAADVGRKGKTAPCRPTCGPDKSCAAFLLASPSSPTVFDLEVVSGRYRSLHTTSQTYFERAFVSLLAQVQAASRNLCLPASHPDSPAFATPSTMPPRHTLSPLSACAPHTSLRKVGGTGRACGSWALLQNLQKGACRQLTRTCLVRGPGCLRGAV